MTWPEPSFEHLLAMSTAIGTFEHADHDVARPSHGYCTDDMARVLIVVSREPRPDGQVVGLGRLALDFLSQAQGVAGHMRNRRGVDGRWQDRRGVEDCWGRSLWAFGVAADQAPQDWMRQSARSSFHHGARQRSRWPRAMAFAALGAAEMLARDDRDDRARRLLADAVDTIGSPSNNPQWPWPESRLRYANAALAEALVAAGAGLERPTTVNDGLRMLAWLLERETNDGHLSVTPAGGAGPEDHHPRFDQQPIEVAAMADACARAESVTGDPTWRLGIELAVRWFEGDNDAGTPMWDPLTGGSYDGLRADGPNLNQGTESTLALVSTAQHARRLLGLAPGPQIPDASLPNRTRRPAAIAPSA
jgi:hypothetical protein